MDLGDTGRFHHLQGWCLRIVHPDHPIATPKTSKEFIVYLQELSSSSSRKCSQRLCYRLYNCMSEVWNYLAIVQLFNCIELLFTNKSPMCFFLSKLSYESIVDPKCQWDGERKQNWHMQTMKKRCYYPSPCPLTRNIQNFPSINQNATPLTFINLPSLPLKSS